MNVHAHEAPKSQKMIPMIICGVVVLLTIYVAFIKKDAVRLETAKVGGSENMSLVQQLYSSDTYKTQQAQAIQQAVASMNQPAADAANPTAEPAAPTSTIDKAKMDAIKKNGHIKGNKNARITILEYSEFLCPYCKRQQDNKVVEQVLAKYPNDVNNMFRSFIVHPQAKILSEAVECIGSIGGSDKYYEAVPQLFNISDQSEAGITTFAKTLVNEAKFGACLKAGKFANKIDVMSDEGRTLFGVTGTPGNVIVDNEKGTYTLIAGAYPVEKFVEIIEVILSK